MAWVFNATIECETGWGARELVRRYGGFTFAFTDGGLCKVYAELHRYEQPEESDKGDGAVISSPLGSPAEESPTKRKPAGRRNLRTSRTAC